MAPKYSSTIEDVVLAIIQQPRGDALLATGNNNVNLEAPEVQEREKEIMATLSAVGLNEISGNFLPQCTSWFWDGRKWSMISRGQELRSRTNYIMGIFFIYSRMWRYRTHGTIYTTTWFWVASM